MVTQPDNNNKVVTNSTIRIFLNIDLHLPSTFNPKINIALGYAMITDRSLDTTR